MLPRVGVPCTAALCDSAKHGRMYFAFTELTREALLKSILTCATHSLCPAAKRGGSRALREREKGETHCPAPPKSSTSSDQACDFRIRLASRGRSSGRQPLPVNHSVALPSIRAD